MFKTQNLDSSRNFFLERAARYILQASVILVMARYLGPEDYGYIGLVTTIFGLLSVISIFGLDQTVIKHALQCRAKSLQMLQVCLIASTLIGSMLLIFSILILKSTDSLISTGLEIILLALPFSWHSIVQVYLLSIGDNRSISLVYGFQALVGSVIRIAFCLTGVEIVYFFWLLLIETILLALVALFLFLCQIAKFDDIRPVRLSSFNIIAEAAPFGLNSLLAFLYLRVDQFMLSVLETPQILGVYFLAIRFLEITNFLLTTAIRAISPSLVALASRNRLEFLRLSATSFRWLLVFSLGASLIVYLYGSSVVSYAFGEEYSRASGAFSVLILCLPALFAGQLSALLAIDESRGGSPMIRTVIGLGVNFVGNYLFIPIYGAIGAAYATTIAFWVSAVLCLCFWNSDRDLLKAFLISARA